MCGANAKSSESRLTMWKLGWWMVRVTYQTLTQRPATDQPLTFTFIQTRFRKTAFPHVGFKNPYRSCTTSSWGLLLKEKHQWKIYIKWLHTAWFEKMLFKPWMHSWANSPNNYKNAYNWAATLKIWSLKKGCKYHLCTSIWDRWPSGDCDYAVQAVRSHFTFFSVVFVLFFFHFKSSLQLLLLF